MSPLPVQRFTARWPTWALVVLGLHAALLTFLYTRPGHVAIVPFVIGPPLLLAVSAVVVGLAAFDLLSNGWRRLVRRRLPFDVLVLASSVLISLLAYRTYPSSHEGHTTGLCMSLPLDGDIAILQGGAGIESNHHAGSPSQRYAYDLAPFELGSTHVGDGAALHDFYAYGRNVLAPMGGTVVSVTDGQPDRPPGGMPWQPWRPVAGNSVVLEVDSGEFVFLTHLLPGSIAVQPGDRVSPGAPIGRVGNSGRSGTPHLHVHMQDSPVAGRGEGIPMDFCNYEVVERGATWDTARAVSRGAPTGRGRPQIIRAMAPSNTRE